MFDFLKNNKEKQFPDEVDTFNRNNIENNIEAESTPEEKEEWVWVEGYKGTDKNMMCRDFQYELNKNYTYNGETKICMSGFHFCPKLDYVFSYYYLDGNNRFFKVKGLINKKEYSNLLTIDKLVAKEIIFTEEVTYNNGLKPYVEKFLPIIKNEGEYLAIKDTGILSFLRNKFLSDMKELGFSELYSQIKYDNLIKTTTGSYIPVNQFGSGNYMMPTMATFVDFYNRINKYISQVKAYKEENISKDLMIYLLEKFK